MIRSRKASFWIMLLALLTVSGSPWNGSANDGQERAPAKGSALRHLNLDTETEEAILALDPERLSEQAVREVLSQAPAPRIINLDGSLPLITMQSFSKFLILMGYPEEKVRAITGGSYTYSSYADSRELAGMVAWHFEQEGMMPILIGHSQGGMRAIKVLHELSGAFSDRIPVWNPLTGKAEDRHTVIDPLTGEERPVRGLKLRFAAAIATGKPMRVLFGQWEMLPRLRRIPDTVEEFTGYTIQWDLIAGIVPGLERREQYRPHGAARVRNVLLPPEYNHLTAPLTAHLAAQETTRRWISQYAPGREPFPLPADPEIDTRNLLLAADLWHHIKKHWCLEAQRLIRAKRSHSEDEE